MAAGEAARASETEAVRQELASEREQLAEAVNRLRQSSDIGAQVRKKLPLALLGAFAIGFVLSGGIGATARLIFRRGRERSPGRRLVVIRR
jgi:hypothetical protein